MKNHPTRSAISRFPTIRKGLPPFTSSLVLPVLLAIAFAAASGWAQAPAVTLVAANYKTTKIEAGVLHSMERGVFDLINDEREKNGRSRLVWTDQAAAVARYHSTNMAESCFFGHEDNDGRRPSQRANLLGLRDWRSIGENIAWLSGFADPVKRVVEGWMKSTGHRENILDPGYRESGIGLAVASDGKYYFTQVFILRK